MKRTHYIEFIYIYIYIYRERERERERERDRGSTVVKVLCYNSDGLIPAGVSGVFIDIKSFALWPCGRLSF